VTNPNQNKFIVPLMHVNNLLEASCLRMWSSYQQLASRRKERKEFALLPETGFNNRFKVFSSPQLASTREEN